MLLVSHELYLFPRRNFLSFPRLLYNSESLNVTHQVKLFPAEKAVVVRVELSERQLDLVKLFSALKEKENERDRYLYKSLLSIVPANDTPFCNAIRLFENRQ